MRPATTPSATASSTIGNVITNDTLNTNSSNYCKHKPHQ
jgi:hypothetical protein